MRWLLLVSVLAAALVAGCVDSGPSPQTPDVADLEETATITCRVETVAGIPVEDAICSFTAATYEVSGAAGPNGTTSLAVPVGLSGSVEARHPEHGAKATALVVRPFTSIRFVLDGSMDIEPAQHVRRGWSDPMEVERAELIEAQIVGDSDDRLFYSSGTTLKRSVDGGATWEDVTPPFPTAMPTLASDTGINVAPDDSVWFTRFWPYLGPTMGCTSSDHGETWTCFNFAVTGPTDRMWIVGLDAQRGYVQAFHGFTVFQWSRTDSGSQTYTPHAFGERSFGIVSNMVYDSGDDAVWQMADCTGSGSATKTIMRVDEGSPLMTARNTPVPKGQAICWLVQDEGTLWTTGEPMVDEQGSRGVVVARTRDQAVSWDLMPVSQEPATTTFSYVAARGDRAAAIYYGAEEPGQADETFARWHVYVAETDNALDAHPTWVETRLVDTIHEGIVCIGADCQLTNQEDPNGRFSLDMIGAWMDHEGNFLGVYSDDYNRDAGEEYHTKAQFLRQYVEP